MQEFLERPIVTLAWLTALVLLFLGIRHISEKDFSSKNRFLSWLAIFMILGGVTGFVGCSDSDVSSQLNSADSPRNTPSSGEQIQTESIDSTSTGSVEKILPIPSSLAEGNRWKNFKRIWRKLDREGPEKTSVFVKTLTYHQAEDYRSELANLLELTPQQINVLQDSPALRIVTKRPPVPVDFVTHVLVRLALHRIDRMQQSRRALSRSVPPPPSPIIRNRINLIREIENRIDHLTNLSEKGQVTEEAFQGGLSKLQKNIYLYSILSLLDHYQLNDSTKQPEKALGKGFENPRSDPDAWIAEFEKSYKSRPRPQNPNREKLIEETYHAIQSDIEKLKRHKAQIDILIADLEG